MDKILPRPGDLSAPYWEACREGELKLQRCSGCNSYQFYPRRFCTGCGGRELEWVVASGNGSVASYSVVRRAISDAYTAPYLIALVDLDEGPRMMSNIIDVDVEAVSIGCKVAVDFVAWSQDVTMPVFRVLEGETAL
ncbi:MAG: OB-fold domain-containing protein [Halieaceae bacterium]